MRAAVVFSLNLLLGLALLGFLLWRYGEPAFHLLAADLSVPLLLGALGLSALTLISLSWRWGYLLAGLGESLSLFKLCIYRSGAHTLAVLIPSGKVGGDPLRVVLTTRAGIPVEPSVASVTVDRTQEIGSTAPFSLIFAALLIQAQVPYIERALITVAVGTLGLAVGVFFGLRRLRRGAGLVSALVRVTRMDQIAFVKSRFDLIEASEQATLQLAEQTQRMLVAFLTGLVSNLLVVAEFALLLSAFDLPSNTTAIAAALFAAGASHLLPIPAGVGVLEGAEMWIFGILGYPADVGLAVGLAVRLREVVWMLPGVIYMLSRSLLGQKTEPSPGSSSHSHELLGKTSRQPKQTRSS